MCEVGANKSRRSSKSRSNLQPGIGRDDLTRTDFENSPYRWREEKRERERSDSTGIDWERDPGINREREREREREVIRLGLTGRETLDWD